MHFQIVAHIRAPISILQVAILPPRIVVQLLIQINDRMKESVYKYCVAHMYSLVNADQIEKSISDG